MSYWEFLGMFTTTGAWAVVSAILAAVVLIGGLAGIAVGATELADRNRHAWIWALVPGVLIPMFFILTFLAWSGTGAWK